MLLAEAWQGVVDFIEKGGGILLVLAGVTFWMWVLICERTLYLLRDQRGDVDRVLRHWSERDDHDSWHAHQIQRMLLCELRHDLTRNLWAIRSFVVVCPMLGLLGTVMGMLEVFDVLAIAGSANIRGLASGVSQATFSTLAGMVAAISGLLAGVQLERLAQRETQAAADRLNGFVGKTPRETDSELAAP